MLDLLAGNDVDVKLKVILPDTIHSLINHLIISISSVQF